MVSPDPLSVVRMDQNLRTTGAGGTSSPPMRVAVLGAGFGGLELTARLSEEPGDRVDVTFQPGQAPTGSLRGHRVSSPRSTRLTTPPTGAVRSTRRTAGWGS